MMEFDKIQPFFIIVAIFVFSSLVLLVDVPEIEAHHKRCDICGLDVDTKAYRMVHFELFFDVDNKNTLIALHNTANQQIISETIKDTRQPLSLLDVKPRDGIFVLRGTMTFTTDVEADKFYSSFKGLMQGRGTEVIYGTIHKTLNTHHLKNPQPDIVLETITIGNIKSVEPHLFS